MELCMCAHTHTNTHTRTTHFWPNGEVTAEAVEGWNCACVRVRVRVRVRVLVLVRVFVCVFVCVCSRVHEFVDTYIVVHVVRGRQVYIRTSTFEEGRIT